MDSENTNSYSKAVQTLLSVCLPYTNTKTERAQAVILSGIMYVEAVLLIKRRRQTTEIWEQDADENVWIQKELNIRNLGKCHNEKLQNEYFSPDIN
jgi:hypothetical protein